MASTRRAARGGAGAAAGRPGRRRRPSASPSAAGPPPAAGSRRRRRGRCRRSPGWSAGPRGGRRRGGSRTASPGPRRRESKIRSSATIGPRTRRIPRGAAGCARPDIGVARPREVGGGVGARGEHRVAGALEVDGPDQGLAPPDGLGAGDDRGLEPEGGPELEERAGARHELHRGGRDARRLGPEAGHVRPVPEPSSRHTRRRGPRVGAAERRERRLDLPGTHRGAGRARQRREGRDGGDERRRRRAAP